MVCRVAPVIPITEDVTLRWLRPRVVAALRLEPSHLFLASDGDAHCMPFFLLTFGNARKPPVGAVIIEAPSMFHARMTAVVRRLARGVPFGESLNLTAKMMTAIPPEEIGRMMSGVEAAELVLRLVQDRGRPQP